jgi:peptidoglycan/xylan/chitin deacetylase (PgdA/CDA1 family)
MYHNVSEAKNSKGLTIWVNKLEQQLHYLKENGYTSFHFKELQSFSGGENKLPKKSVIITFDDVYVNQLKFAYPLLQKYQLKASFFIPFKYLGALDSWNSNEEKIMSVSQLKSMDSKTIELGLHSFCHEKYNELSILEIEKDFEECRMVIEQYDLPVQNVLAYPYGKYPRKNPEQLEFFKCLENHNIRYGLRIGNRINQFPFKNNYEIQRIDIKGEDSLLKFNGKLRFGKLKLF